MECTLAMQIKDEKEAERMLQEQLFSSYNQLGWTLWNLCTLAHKQNHTEKLASCLTLIEALQQSFQFPLSIASQLYPFFIALQDEEATLYSLRMYIEQLQCMEHHLQTQQKLLSQSPWFSLVRLKENTPQAAILPAHLQDILKELLQNKEISQWPSVQAYLQEVLQNYQTQKDNEAQI